MECIISPSLSNFSTKGPPLVDRSHRPQRILDPPLPMRATSPQIASSRKQTCPDLAIYDTKNVAPLEPLARHPLFLPPPHDLQTLHPHPPSCCPRISVLVGEETHDIFAAFLAEYAAVHRRSRCAPYSTQSHFCTVALTQRSAESARPLAPARARMGWSHGESTPFPTCAFMPSKGRPDVEIVGSQAVRALPARAGVQVRGDVVRGLHGQAERHPLALSPGALLRPELLHRARQTAPLGRALGAGRDRLAARHRC
eukprot:3061241-Rhodomonas_salina.1